MVLASGQKTITLAPEAGSERMRRVVRKGFTEAEILGAAEILVDRGISNLRLYFMIGLPAERVEDVKAIVDLTKKIRHHLLKRSRGLKKMIRMNLSVNSFVPKPATPFQWHPFEDVHSLNDKIKTVKKGLQKEKGVSVAADVPKWAYLQSLLSHGDRRVGESALDRLPPRRELAAGLPLRGPQPGFLRVSPPPFRRNPPLGFYRSRDPERIPLGRVPGSPERGGNRVVSFALD